MQPPSSSSQLRAGTQGPRGVGWGGHTYLAETGFPGGPGAASLITAHNLLVWRRKVGIGREGGNKMDIIWTEWEGVGHSPRARGSLCWTRASGLGAGGLGRCCRWRVLYSLVGLHFPLGWMGLPS